MATIPVPISVLPVPPSTASPSDFDSKADAFLGALPILRTEINTISITNYNNTIEANTAATAAATSALATGATLWSSLNSYTQNSTVWSPIDNTVYLKKSAGTLAAGGTDPSLDTTNINWVSVGGAATKIYIDTNFVPKVAANYNTAIGYQALMANTTGSNNIAIGYQALKNTTGTGANHNIGIGYLALGTNTIGTYNIAVGFSALVNNTTGQSNVAIGYQAGQNNTTGFNNVAIGRGALINNTTGSGNVSIAPRTNTGTDSPAFNITTENNRISMGSTSVTNAYIQVAWTAVSDARDKTDFAPVPHGLEFVTKLKPTAYRYKVARSDIEGHGPLRYGFKAQDILELEGRASVIVDSENLEKLRINDQCMLAVLVNALQELKQELDLVKAELQNLRKV